MIISTETLIQAVLIPAFSGIFIPYITKMCAYYNLPEEMQTGLNAALSALAAAASVTPFGGTWKEYLLALAIAWFATGRSDQTKLPDKLWAKQVTGRHSRSEVDFPGG